MEACDAIAISSVRYIQGMPVAALVLADRLHNDNA